jgi:hypothetical protein
MSTLIMYASLCMGLGECKHGSWQQTWAGLGAASRSWALQAWAGALQAEALALQAGVLALQAGALALPLFVCLTAVCQLSSPLLIKS